MTYRASRTTARRTLRVLVVGPLLVVAAIAVSRAIRPGAFTPFRDASPTPTEEVVPVPATAWPAHGQAAVLIAASRIQAGPNQHPAAIASVAKVMTAYLVLRDHPLRVGEDGPTITLTEEDVADTERRRRQQESLVPIVAGEQLTELQALQALLLPSANNIAAALARWDAGSTQSFVAEMNDTARELDMTDTHYTDPSGYDDATVSTAADQLRIVDRAMSVPAFASIVATPSVRLPVAGIVHNTDTLLGKDGFVGVKTGSDEAAGGCFAFRAIRTIDGKQRTITGVVLGQVQSDQIAAALLAADAIVDGIAGGGRAQESPQRIVSPRDAPSGERPPAQGVGHVSAIPRGQGP